MKQEYDYALSSMDIDWLIDQGERFEKMKKEFAEDIDFKRREVVELKKAGAGWAKQYEDLQEVNQRYKEALEFYADEKNYVRPYDNENFFDYLPSEMDFDKGERARKELKGEST